MTRFGIFAVAWALTGGLILIYLVVGEVRDLVRAVNERKKQRVLDVLSVVLFEPDEEAERVHEQAAELPTGVLLSVIQSLAVDFNGQAGARIQHLVRALGLERFIRRRAKSRRWRMRTQAAQLQYLIDHPDFDRHGLLTDRHHVVRARAVESLTPLQAKQHLEVLVESLGDDSVAVRLAAQQKLVELGSGAVPALLGELQTGTMARAGARQALEVAANIADPRLVSVLDVHASSDDPRVRETAARALGGGAGPGAAEVLERLCHDEDVDVRVAAIDGLAHMESLTSAGRIGRALRDQAWAVRRAAGLALDKLGAPGRLVLRTYLSDHDAYARDMARQILDAAAARDGLVLFAPLDALDIDATDAEPPGTDIVPRGEKALAKPISVASGTAVLERPATEELFSSIDEELLEALLGSPRGDDLGDDDR